MDEDWIIKDGLKLAAIKISRYHNISVRTC